MSSGLVDKCCTSPPVEAEYTPKGSFETIAGLKTYTAGPADAKKLVVYVYDIFGVTPQVQQGADLIAASGVKVWMPDFFSGWGADHTLFAPPRSDEKAAKIGAIFGPDGEANVGKHAVKFEEVVAAAKAAGFESIGSIGFCWGAKVLIQSPNLQAKAGVHPSLFAKEDIDLLTVPTALWPTADEDMEVFNSIKAGLEGKPFKAFVEHLPELHHGFAAARADLKQEKDRADFAWIYGKINAFFAEVL